MEKNPFLTDIPLKMIKTVILQFCSVIRLGHMKNLIIDAQTSKKLYTVIIEQLVASDNIHEFHRLIGLINSTGVIPCICDDFGKEIEEICISSQKMIGASHDNLHILNVIPVNEQCAELENASLFGFDRHNAPNEDFSQSLKHFYSPCGDNT